MPRYYRLGGGRKDSFPESYDTIKSRKDVLRTEQAKLFSFSLQVNNKTDAVPS